MSSAPCAGLLLVGAYATSACTRASPGWACALAGLAGTTRFASGTVLRLYFASRSVDGSQFRIVAGCQ